MATLTPVAGGATPPAPPGRATRTRRSPRARSLGRGSALGLGIALVWFSLLVLIPLAAVVVEATGGGLDTYASVFTNEQTFDALKLTVTASFVITVFNVVMGTVIAWVLVRDHFWGKGLLDVIIDVPFAMPTIVAGLVLLALYGTGGPLGLSLNNTPPAVYLAIAFVTVPFVVRTVQPVLEELDTDVEDAAAALGASRFTTFRRVVLPSLIPAIFAGAALSFARGISEYGAMVLLSGNLAGRTEVASFRVKSMLEGDNRPQAAALATVMLLVALAAIVILDISQRKLARRG